MSSNIKISVIIPTYKRAKDLKRAVNSVQNQTMKDIEILVIDDNDPDSKDRLETESVMLPIIKEDNRVKYIQHKKNLNGAAARNTGIKRSKGKYVAFLDDDDYYLPNKLETNFATLESLSKEYACVISNCFAVKNGKIVRTIDVDGEEKPLQKVLSCTYRIGSVSNLFVRKQVLEEVGGFNEKLRRHQDYDVEAKIFSRYKVKKIPECLFCVELYSEHTNIPNIDKAIEYRRVFMQLHTSLINEFSKNEINQIYSASYYNLCELAIKNKRLKKAKKLLDIANRYNRLSLKKRIILIIKTIFVFFPEDIKLKMRFGR